MTIETVWRDYDVIVVGSGGAGSAAAHAAAETGADVLVVAKDPIGCSDTKIAEGIVTVRASGDDDDSETELAENLRIAGADLPSPEIAAAFAQDTRDAYDWMRRHGVRPDMDGERDGPKALALPLGGHTRRRSVGHRNGGLAVGHAAWNAVVQGRRIDYLEDAWFLDVVIGGEERGVVGGLVYDAANGTFVAVRAPSVVIAAGGLSTLYFPKTDTMRGNTGDSYAIALRAGAELVDMEQVQFLPFCMTHPPAYEGLCAGEPATAGYLGVLRDRNGKVILDGVMLRTRAECSAAIVRAVADGRGTERDGCYLDLTGNAELERSAAYYDNFLNNSLSGVMATVRQAWGRKAARCREMWEVRPGAHYAMGGVSVDASGAALAGAPRGLYAAGQAMGGVFGANRLGSTSLSEGPIFGTRAGCAAAERAREGAANVDSAAFEGRLDAWRRRLGRGSGGAPALAIKRLQAACWDGIGPARTREKLDRFVALLAELRAAAADARISGEALWNQSFIDSIELANMLDTAETVALSALQRERSLGAHVRLDGRQASALFGTPYSVAVHRRGDGSLAVHRAPRRKTSWRRLLPYLANDRKRKIWLKILRLLPRRAQDRLIEDRYRATMGELAAPERAAAA